MRKSVLILRNWRVLRPFDGADINHTRHATLRTVGEEEVGPHRDGETRFPGVTADGEAGNRDQYRKKSLQRDS